MDLDRVLELVRSDLETDAREGRLPHDVATRMYTQIKAKLSDEKTQKNALSSAAINDPLVVDYLNRAELAEREDSTKWD